MRKTVQHKENLAKGTNFKRSQGFQENISGFAWRRTA
jgi:hypothetical protein